MLESARTELVDRLQRRLIADAGRAGWGYYAGKASRIEPTCWALLALAGAWNEGNGVWPDFARPHLGFLSGTQGTDGLLSDTEPSLANFTVNGLAAVALSQFAPLVSSSTGDRLLDALTAAKGVAVKQSGAQQDNQLQGWPWVTGTFSWVEPTAWCLLALKKVVATPRRSQIEARVREAERLLGNRMCSAGGWNYGNASTLGQDLRAYVPTTAMGLLSMQDRRGDTVVQQSLRRLQDDRLNEPSTLALSLAAVCLRVYGQPTDDIDERLAHAVTQSEEYGHLQPIAMAAYALSAERHKLEAFHVKA